MTLKIGFIGFGRVVKWHIKQLQNLDIEVVFVCDKDKTSLKQARKLLPSIKLFSDIEDLLSDNKIDIDYVIISTPSGTHFDIAKLISTNKKWGLVIEKPTFLAPKHFAESRKWDNMLIPIFQNRYNESVIKAESFLYEDKIGPISHASLSLDWSRPQRYYGQAEWRGTWLNDGGVSTNQGIHYFDITRHLLGNFISTSAIMKRIGVDIECEDYLIAHFRMEKGFPLDVRMTTALRHSNENASLSIHGTKGSIKLHGVCCNKIDLELNDSPEIKSYGNEVEIAYGYGHKVFYKLLANQEGLSNLKLATLSESFDTMRFIYSSYESAISGNRSNKKEDYKNMPLGTIQQSSINFYE